MAITHDLQYPNAVDVSHIGKYPISVKAGGGYFYDEILEYRVWVHPERGGKDIASGEDYFYPFASYSDALIFSQQTPGAEPPLVLVRQIEWINEPQSGVFVHITGERLTEWQPAWLGGRKRTPNSIPDFIRRKDGA